MGADLHVVDMPIDEIMAYEGNAKEHPDWQVAQIAESIRQFGFSDPVGIWHDEQGRAVIVEGHGRVMAAKSLGMETVPTISLDHMTDEERRAYTLAHNKLTTNTDYDDEILAAELAGIGGIDMAAFGFDIDNDIDDGQTNETRRRLIDDYVVPPFSVLDARQPYWTDREDQWLAMMGTTVYDARQGIWSGRKKQWAPVIADDGSSRGGARAYNIGNSINDDPRFRTSNVNDTSILDPVLAEVIVRYFMPRPEHGTACFDTFAGDTAFGFVAAALGKTFTGIELREEQAAHNQAAADAAGLANTYICDDGRNVDKHIPPKSQDLFFSCPPYYDLEVYSDLPNDASNQPTFDAFYAILDEAFAKSAQALKDDRFAVVVCTELRDRDGYYVDFPRRVIDTFERCGMRLYNNIVLVNPFSTAAIRADGNMRHRKVVRVHQNVLVFFNGDTKRIHDIYGDVMGKEADPFARKDA